MPLLSSSGNCSCKLRKVTASITCSIDWRLPHTQAAEEHKRLRADDNAKVKALAAQKAAFEPRWFEKTLSDKSQIGKQYLYRYKGGYWEERAAKGTA